jgi:Peptidase_C39 like family
MIRIVLFFSLLVISITLYFISQTSVNILSVPPIYQKMYQWCWAASTQTILNYYGNPVEQCEIVNKSISPSTDCCSGTPCIDIRTCNRPMQFDYYQLDVLSKFNTTCDSAHKIFTWEKVMEQIDNNKPFILTNLIQKLPIGFVQQPGNHIWNEHQVTAFGYVNTDYQKWILIRDPWQVCKGCTYAIEYETFLNGGLNVEATPNSDLDEDNSSIPVVFYDFKVANSPAPTLVTKFSQSFSSFAHSIVEIFNSKDNIADKSKTIDKGLITKHILSFIDKVPNVNLWELGLLNSKGTNLNFSEPIIRKSYFLKTLPVGFNADFINTHQDRTDVVVINVLDSRGNPLFEITMFKNGDFWQIAKIASCPWFSIEKSLANEFPSAKVTKLISFPPSKYEFYQFNYDGEFYYYQKPDKIKSNISKNDVLDKNQFDFAIKNILYDFDPEVHDLIYPNLNSGPH